MEEGQFPLTARHLSKVPCPNYCRTHGLWREGRSVIGLTRLSSHAQLNRKEGGHLLCLVPRVPLLADVPDYVIVLVNKLEALTLLR